GHPLAEHHATTENRVRSGASAPASTSANHSRQHPPATLNHPPAFNSTKLMGPDPSYQVSWPSVLLCSRSATRPISVIRAAFKISRKLPVLNVLVPPRLSSAVAGHAL